MAQSTFVRGSKKQLLVGALPVTVMDWGSPWWLEGTGTFANGLPRTGENTLFTHYNGLIKQAGLETLHRDDWKVSWALEATWRVSERLCSIECLMQQNVKILQNAWFRWVQVWFFLMLMKKLYNRNSVTNISNCRIGYGLIFSVIATYLCIFHLSFIGVVYVHNWGILQKDHWQ